MDMKDLKALDGLLVDELDEQTKRELLIGGIHQLGSRRPESECRWCKGTGKVKLLTSEQDCECVSVTLNRLCPESGGHRPGVLMRRGIIAVSRPADKHYHTSVAVRGQGFGDATTRTPPSSGHRRRH